MPVPERQPADVTGMGKSLDVTGMGQSLAGNPIFAFMYGAAAAFGGGGLGARVPADRQRAPKVRLSRRAQWLLAAGVYGPLIILPLLVWLVSRSWQTTLVLSVVVLVCVFFGVGFVAMVVSYRRSKAGLTD